MNPLEFLAAGTPTLNDIVSRLVAGGADRGSLVRRAHPGRRPAVAILLLAPQAMRDVGPFLVRHCTSLPVPDPAHQNYISLRGDSNLSLAFQTVDDTAEQWAWGPLKWQNGSGTVVFIVGPSVTDALALELTRRGVNTTLT